MSAKKSKFVVRGEDTDDFDTVHEATLPSVIEGLKQEFIDNSEDEDDETTFEIYQLVKTITVSKKTIISVKE